jgi:hypothetical protein
MMRDKPPETTPAPRISASVTPPESDQNAARQKPGGVASVRSVWRGILVGMALIPPNAFWINTVEAVQFGPYVTTLSLFSNVLFWLLFLVAANGLLRRWLPRLALSQGDLLTAYAILAAGSAITSCDLLQILMHYIGHPVWANSVMSGSSASYIDLTPTWLTVTDPEALKGYYNGNASMYRLAVLRAWGLPIACWMLFILLLSGVMMCLNSLLRARWADQERLPFPLIQLPVEMTTPSQSLWKNKLFWGGLALAGGIDLWNGFAYLYPSLPTVPINWQNIEPLFTEKPWKALGWTTISFYPIVIGIGYLLPMDLLFSFWFFFLFWKSQRVIASAMGWDITPQFPYIEHQGFGAILMVGLTTLWSARHYLKEVWKCARGRPSSLDDSGEALRYRTALIGFAASFVGLLVFCRLAGLRWGWAFAFFAIYTIVILTVTRIRAEFGAPVHDFINGAPEVMMTDVLGTQMFTHRDLTVMSLFYWFSKLHRGDVMPHGMEALKLADNERVTRRTMLKVFMAAIFFGALAGFWSMLHQGYALGNAAKWGFPAYAGWETFNRLNSWIESPRLPNSGMGMAVASGGLVCLGLVLLRQTFPWWPFHPISFTITATFQANLVWLPLLIAWVIKGVVLRTGGRSLYVRFLPFFYGLILGQAVFGSFWSFVSVVTGKRMYSFWGY